MRFLLAMLPPGQFWAGLVVGISLVAAILFAVLRGRPHFASRRTHALCVLAAIVGPLAGAGLAAIAAAFGHGVDPLDRWPLESGLLTAGASAGLLAAVITGLVALARGMRLHRYTWLACLIALVPLVWVQCMGKDLEIVNCFAPADNYVTYYGWPLRSWASRGSIVFAIEGWSIDGESMWRTEAYPLATVFPAAAALDALLALSMLVAVGAICERLMRRRCFRFTLYGLFIAAIAAAVAAVLFTSKCTSYIQGIVAITTYPWTICGLMYLEFSCLIYQIMALAIRLARWFIREWCLEDISPPPADASRKEDGLLP